MNGKSVSVKAFKRLRGYPAAKVFAVKRKLVEIDKEITPEKIRIDIDGKKWIFPVTQNRYFLPGFYYCVFRNIVEERS